MDRTWLMAISYQELAAFLRDRIQDGTFRQGTTLPRQQDLAREYGMNIKSVRLAIAMLESEGLVTPIRRRGTLVRQRNKLRRLETERYARRNWRPAGLAAFAADRQAPDDHSPPDDRAREARLVQSDAEVAAALGVEPGTSVVERCRLVKTSEGDPTHILVSYYCADDVKDSPLMDPRRRPAWVGTGFAVLSAQGLEPARITETLHARMPDPAERELLRLLPGVPVVVLHRLTSTTDGRVVEFARGVHAANWFAWTYSFDIPD
jgi:GntR family transcriptional regulator